MYCLNLNIFHLSLQINSFKDCPSSGLGRNITGSDILQKHSINSLLEQNDLMNRNGLVTPGVDSKFFFVASDLHIKNNLKFNSVISINTQIIKKSQEC